MVNLIRKAVALRCIATHSKAQYTLSHVYGTCSRAPVHTTREHGPSGGFHSRLINLQIFPTINSLPASKLTTRTLWQDRLFWASRFLLLVLMAALWNRAGHYIFALWFLSSIFYISFSSPNLSGRRLDVYHTSTPWCGPSANLECRSEIWCVRLAANAGPKKSPSGHHRTNLSGYIFATNACIDNRKKILKQQYLLHMSW